MPPLMASELPEVARTWHHWITLVRLPRHRLSVAALLALFAWGLFEPAMLAVFAIVVIVNLMVRYRTWRAEMIILTRKRIIRVQGVPETTNTEASLRIDRVSGARLIQSVPGKLLDYGTIELEAPGDHPDVRRLIRIAEPNDFYDKLRVMIFADRNSPDPDEGGRGSRPPGGPPPPPLADSMVSTTQPLPRLGPPGLRKR